MPWYLIFWRSIMAYPNITRVLNKDDLTKDAMIRIRQKKVIDLSKYTILSSGIFEAMPQEDGSTADILQVIVCDKECNQHKEIIKLTDLNLSPREIFNYYLYRFDIRNIHIGDAIRVVKEATDKYPDTFAYNAIVMQCNIRQISFVMVPSRGPAVRTITARQAYHQGVKIYVYHAPDDYTNTDNMDISPQCDMIR